MAWIKGQYKNFEMKFGALAQKSIYDITPKDLTGWRNNRLTQVGENIVLKEISHYSAMFTFAQKELFLLEENPWMQMTKPKKPKARTRRIHPSEVALMLKVLNYEMGTVPTLIYAELSGDFPLGDSRQPTYKSLRPFDLVS